MNGTAYSSLKAAWHSGHIETLRAGGIPTPKHVHLVISDLCNQDCHFCAYRIGTGFSSEQFGIAENGVVNHNPNRKIPTGKVKEILDDCAAVGVKAVQFTGGGEPTVHPDHIQLIRYALDLGLECSLVTNGYLLRDGWDHVFPRLSWIRVSVDADSPATYARVRNVGLNAYQRTLTNVKAISARLAATSSECVFGAGYVITRENWKDLPRGVEALRDAGVGYVRLTAMFSKEYQTYYSGVDLAIRDQIAAAKRLETPTFGVVDLYGLRMTDMTQQAPDYDICGYQYFTTYIGANLKVYRCCTTSYTAHGEIGDLSAQRFATWLDCDERKQKCLPFNPRTCEICQFNNQNRVINYLVDPSPLHVEFV